MNEAQYWDAVAREWQADDHYTLWRIVSDDLHIGLLRRWDVLPAKGLTLKTDLFDEAAAGGLGRVLAAESAGLLGMDISAGTASGARQHLPQSEIIVADVRALPLDDASVVLIVSNSTLDHFPDHGDIARSLTELARVLADGGQLLVTLDNPQHPVIWLRQHLPWHALHALGLVPYQVGATLSLAELAQTCRDCGLVVEKTGTLMHCPRVLAVWVGRLLHRLGVRSARGYRRFFGGWEILERWPTHCWSGRFVAVLASKRSAVVSATTSGAAS